MADPLLCLEDGRQVFVCTFINQRMWPCHVELHEGALVKANIILNCCCESSNGADGECGAVVDGAADCVDAVILRNRMNESLLNK